MYLKLYVKKRFYSNYIDDRTDEESFDSAYIDDRMGDESLDSDYVDSRIERLSDRSAGDDTDERITMGSFRRYICSEAVFPCFAELEVLFYVKHPAGDYWKRILRRVNRQTTHNVTKNPIH